MRVRVIAFGKLKTPGLRQAADYYRKRVDGWLPVQETELKALEIPEKSDPVRSRILEKEATILRDKIEKDAGARRKGLVYLLDEKGKTLTTRQWAQLFRDWEMQSIPEVVFCLGSSLGFSESIRKEAQGSLSLGVQTLSYELARVVLYEQLYRAYSVVQGHPYHND